MIAHPAMLHPAGDPENLPCVASAQLEQVALEFAQLAQIDLSDEAAAYHQVVSDMHRLCVAILAAEQSGLSREKISAASAPARKLHELSPFVRRLQTWPRGYPGDFETIEYLCNAVVRAPRHSIGYFIEHHCLRGISAQQHRNKIAWQARLILETALGETNAKILSIACGGSPDIRSIQHTISGSGCEVYLNDMDPDAIIYSLDQLPALREAIHVFPGDVFNFTRRLRSVPPLELILAGGLFDYLDDRQIIWLLPKLFDALRFGGQLCFTNIASGNPDRVWLDYLAGWHLIERSESDIRRLLNESGVSVAGSTRITTDLTGLTSLVQVTKLSSPQGA